MSIIPTSTDFEVYIGLKELISITESDFESAYGQTGNWRRVPSQRTTELYSEIIRQLEAHMEAQREEIEPQAFNAARELEAEADFLSSIASDPGPPFCQDASHWPTGEPSSHSTIPADTDVDAFPEAILTMEVRDVIRMIEEEGWFLVEQHGSHRQYKHVLKKGRVTIPGKPGKELAKGTWNSILKHAGLK